MAENTVPVHVRQGTFKLSDNNNANSYTVRFTDGKLNVSVPGTEAQLLLDRNQISDTPRVIKGADRPFTFDFEAELIDIASPTDDTLHDILNQANASSDWVSTLGSGAGKPYLLHFLLTNDQSTESGVTTYLYFKHCKLEYSITIDTPSKIKVTGTSMSLKPVPSRSAPY